MEKTLLYFVRDCKSVFSDTAISEMFHSHLRKSQRRSPGDALWKSSKKFNDIPGKHP